MSRSEAMKATDLERAWTEAVQALEAANEALKAVEQALKEDAQPDYEVKDVEFYRQALRIQFVPHFTQQRFRWLEAAAARRRYQ